MAKIINTLEEAVRAKILRRGKRYGNSTRIADMAIQYLFDGYTVMVRDVEGLREADDRLYRTIMERLSKEHNIDANYIEKIKGEFNTIRLSLPYSSLNESECMITKLDL